MVCLPLPEVQDPYAVVVLLEKDLIVVDLTQSKYVFDTHCPNEASCFSSATMMSVKTFSSYSHLNQKEKTEDEFSLKLRWFLLQND